MVTVVTVDFLKGHMGPVETSNNKGGNFTMNNFKIVKVVHPLNGEFLKNLSFPMFPQCVKCYLLSKFKKE